MKERVYKNPLVPKEQIHIMQQPNTRPKRYAEREHWVRASIACYSKTQEVLREIRALRSDTTANDIIHDLLSEYLETLKGQE